MQEDPYPQTSEGVLAYPKEENIENNMKEPQLYNMQVTFMRRILLLCLV